MAESIRSKRHLEVQNSIYGFRDKEKLKGSFFEFFDALTEKKKASLGNYGNWNAVRILIKEYNPKDVTFERLDKEFLSVQETAILLGASRWTIQRMIQRAELKAGKLGRRTIIPRSEIDNLFN